MAVKEFKGANLNDAIAKASQELGVNAESLKYEIIAKGGLLRKAVISVEVQQTKSVNAVEEIKVAETAKKVEAANEIKKVEENKESKIFEKDETVIEIKNTEEKTVAKSAEKSVSENVEDIENEGKTKEIEKAVIAFVQGVIDKMGVECALEAGSTKEALTIKINGADVNYIIGYRGETLDSLQYLALLVANKNGRYRKKLIIDAGDYRERREKDLVMLAKRLAHKVAKTGADVELEPMSPAERRIIHSALQGDKFVTTASEGVEPNRYVVIALKKDNDEVEMYNSQVSKNFKKEGIKTRSFGQKKRRF